VAEHPLYLITPHACHRANSQFANDARLLTLEPQRLWVNPQDAAARGIRSAMEVREDSPRGTVRLPGSITEDITPGVVGMAAGMWPRIGERPDLHRSHRTQSQRPHRLGRCSGSSGVIPLSPRQLFSQRGTLRSSTRVTAAMAIARVATMARLGGESTARRLSRMPRKAHRITRA